MSGTHSPKTEKSKSGTSRKIMFEIVVILALVTVLGFCTVLWLAGDSVEGLLSHLLTRDEQVLADYLKQEGLWRGLSSVLLVEVLQVISIVIPGMAIQLASGMIFTWWQAFLFCYIGFTCGHALVFFIVRRTRARNGRMVERYRPDAVLEEEAKDDLGLPDVERSLAVQLMQKMRTSNPVLVVMLSCLTPGLPNGIIPHIAARTGITGRGFVTAITASSWLQILCNCLAGHFLFRGDYMFMAMSILAQIAVTILVARKREWILSRFSRFSNPEVK